MDFIELYVREIIKKYIAPSVPVEDIGSEEDLNFYGLDGLNVVVISVDLEKKYNIEIDEEVIIDKKIKTIADWCKYVKELTAK
ncbi:MAG: acyl carrier protein [Lachnospiraceae bacterium]|jgi:acyl carrier protein|nr:acyl carrier protein [Lachnospiraceae bacterium]